MRESMVRVHQDPSLREVTVHRVESQPEKKSLLGKCEYSNGFSGSGTHTHAITHKSAFHVFIIKSGPIRAKRCGVR